MNVLSLFDGMSCGQIALNRLGYTIDNYFAAEIDKYAIQVTQANFPNTIQIGDVTKVRGADLPQIDLIIGGSPCQGFSFAGKQLNFDDPRSALFFEFVRLVKECKPKYFFLENVKMKKEHQDVISEYMGVEPVELNSARVSAQNRKRLYWTNIPGYVEPEDKGILLKDIIEDGFADRDKGYCIDANYHKGGNLKQYFEKSRRQLIFNNVEGKAPTLTTNKGEGSKITGLVLAGHATDIKGHDSIKRVYSPEGKAPTLTTMGGGHREPKIALETKAFEGVEKITNENGDLVWRVPEATKKGFTDIKPGEFVDLTFIKSKTRRGRKMENKSNCLTSTSFDYCQATDFYFRKLTPIECERLQTVPDNYTNHVSNSQRYKMLGNGWTVDAVCEFFKHIEQDI